MKIVDSAWLGIETSRVISINVPVDAELVDIVRNVRGVDACFKKAHARYILDLWTVKAFDYEREVKPAVHKAIKLWAVTNGFKGGIVSYFRRWSGAETAMYLGIGFLCWSITLALLAYISANYGGR